MHIKMLMMMMKMMMQAMTWNAWMMQAAMVTKTRLTTVSQRRVAIQ